LLADHVADDRHFVQVRGKPIEIELAGTLYVRRRLLRIRALPEVAQVVPRLIQILADRFPFHCGAIARDELTIELPDALVEKLFLLVVFRCHVLMRIHFSVGQCLAQRRSLHLFGDVQRSARVACFDEEPDQLAMIAIGHRVKQLSLRIGHRRRILSRDQVLEQRARLVLSSEIEEHFRA
jgi:hypothetical protein